MYLLACTMIPETGEQALILTSPSYENSLGAQGYKEVLAKEKVNKDPHLNSILLRVGERIAAQTETKGFSWEFRLIESKQLNAWCMPGGKVAFYTGIIPSLKTEAGMAVVMGHEVAHATLRHSGQRITQTMLLGLGLSVSEIALSNKKYKNDIMGLLGAGATVGVILPYGREHESEADRVGLKYMAKAGYDPREAVAFWQRFGKATSGGAPPEFLSTHPASNRRASDLKKQLPVAMKYYKAAKTQFGMGEAL
jgi:predicted Zn-dependent protease